MGEMGSPAGLSLVVRFALPIQNKAFWRTKALLVWRSALEEESLLFSNRQSASTVNLLHCSGLFSTHSLTHSLTHSPNSTLHYTASLTILMQINLTTLLTHLLTLTLVALTLCTTTATTHDTCQAMKTLNQILPKPRARKSTLTPPHSLTHSCITYWDPHCMFDHPPPTHSLAPSLMYL
jgi:hypothetical protein